MPTASRTTGTWRKKIKRQPTLSVRKPPAVGPSTLARAKVEGTMLNAGTGSDRNRGACDGEKMGS